MIEEKGQEREALAKRLVVSANTVRLDLQSAKFIGLALTRYHIIGLNQVEEFSETQQTMMIASKTHRRFFVKQ